MQARFQSTSGYLSIFRNEFLEVPFHFTRKELSHSEALIVPMSDFENQNSTPEEPIPAEESTPATEPTPAEEPATAPDPTSEETPTSEEIPPAQDTPALGEAPASKPVQTPPPATAYRWSYSEQAAHDVSAKKGKGVMVYALVMTGVFLISFGLLIAVLLLGDDTGFTGLLRPGITDEENRDQAVVGVEQAKQSVVVIEVKTQNGGGTGTGIVMTSDGYIATNHHVIEGATKIKVTFYNKTVLYADVVGSSEMDDLAVIKVEAMGLLPATFAYSEDCYVGQTVYAIGTPAGADFAWTTTRGIISYKDREVKIYDETDGTLKKKLRLLQTDANVNPGNSGGPLVNTKGEVVGVVSMKLAEGYEGMGFAIPSDGAVEILEAIMKDGNADNVNSSLSHKRPMLGITGVFVEADAYYLPTEEGVQRILETELGDYDPSALIHPAVSGIYVMSCTEGMDAASKLRKGDVITAVQGEEIESMTHLMSIVNEYYAGDTVTLTVYRGRVYTPVDIVLSPKGD